ncbi:hypothetical protein PAMP_023005 [Pampus punctatissimus]
MQRLTDSEQEIKTASGEMKGERGADNDSRRVKQRGGVERDRSREGESGVLRCSEIQSDLGRDMEEGRRQRRKEGRGGDVNIRHPDIHFSSCLQG